jgi:hypothetical protein
MDQSVQNYMAPEATQSIASAHSGFDNPGTCVKKSVERPPRLKTVSPFDMSIKGAWRTRRDLYRSLCRTPKGRVSFEAAELYDDILDLFIGNVERVQNFNKRDGCYYWGRSIAKWAKRYKCTQDQFDGWLKILRDRGLIATCMMKTPTNMLQIRPLVAAGSACLSGWPDEQNYAHLLKAQTQAQQGSAGTFGPNALAAKQPQCIGGNLAPPKSLGFAVSSPCTKQKVFVAASLATESPAVIFPGQSGKTSQKQNQPVLPDAVVKAPKFCTASEKNSAGLLWLSLVVQYLPEHELPLKGREWKIVRDLCNRIDSMADLPGHEPVLRWVIQNWLLWAKPIGYTDQVAPSKLTTVLDTAVAGYREERLRLAEKEAHKAAMAKALQAEKTAAPPLPKKLNKFAQQLADEQASKPVTLLPEVVACADMPALAEPALEPATWQDVLDSWKPAAPATPKTSISAGTSPKFGSACHA